MKDNKHGKADFPFKLTEYKYGFEEQQSTTVKQNSE